MRHRAEPKTGSEDADLARLLAAEVELERLLADARKEAAGLLADAAATAGARERGLDAQMQTEAADLQKRLDGERTQREAEIQAAAEADAVRYERMSDERVEAIAMTILGRLVGLA